MRLKMLVSAVSACIVVAGSVLASASTASATQPPVTGAAFTTTNTSVDGTGHCQNGNEDVNCNIYDGKQYVWMNGGPSVAYVGDGSYFFAVLAPGGQADPNDSAAKNLSDDFDAYPNRTFTVTGGTVSYAGSHDFANNKIRLMPHADTPNPGGVYILAICSLSSGYPVTPSKCKYDAFKVNEAPPAEPLTVTKDANGSYDASYTWQLTKSVDTNLIKQVSGNATFTYTVTATRSAATITNVKVTGTITVFNPNDDPVSGVDVTDELSDGTTCTVTNGSDATVVKGDNLFAYTCNLSGLPQGDLANTVTATWAEQFLDNGSLLAADSANFTFNKIVFTANNVTDECASVSDRFNGTTTGLGTVCATTTWTYSQTVPVPPFGYSECLSYDNTATLTTNDTGTILTASQTVKVCGAAKTGARNMTYWKGSAGQGVVTSSASTGGVCNVTGWLRQYAPFQGLASNASCASAAAYVKTTVKAAIASGATMGARLKGHTLATALDVYFTDTTLGGNALKAKKPIGGAVIDLTTVCQMTDGTTGASTCGGSYVDATSAFGGAGSLSVSALLAYATGQSNSGGTTWYGGSSTLQELARTTFAAVNNQKAFRG
jgi:hypothetical protein